MTKGTIIRKPKTLPTPQGPLTDAEKYNILNSYSNGVPVNEIALSVSRDRRDISMFIQGMLKSMTAIRDTNDLIVGTTEIALKHQQGSTNAKFITTSFLTLVESNAEMYAYYFAMTGDNKFALAQSGLDVGIPTKMSTRTRDYIFKIRGQFLRDLAPVRSIIKEEQDKRMRECNVEKPQVQMMLVEQIEELKEIVVDNPVQRGNLLKSIEMLGRSIGAFTDRIEVEETDAKSGLQILMERARTEAGGVETYEQKK